MKISIVGLGKLGSCMAAVFALRGFEVIGVDSDRKIVDSINAAKAPVFEPGLDKLLKKYQSRIVATTQYSGAVKDSDITFLIVPTPSKKNGEFSSQYLGQALRQLGSQLKSSNKKYHLFVITSTVSPGTIERDLIPLVASVSGKKLNQDFGICYNPEFIALGNVINDLLNPDLVLIGEINPSDGEKLVKIYKKFCQNKPHIARMSVISAEIAKLSLNAYITTKISFANILARICENVPGANVDEITSAIGQDKRVSPYFFKGGPSYGGPCFPRDNKAFVAFAKNYGVEAELAKATGQINDFQVKVIVSRILKILPRYDNTMAILGMSYKPETPVIDESTGVRVASELLKKKITNLKIIVYDSLALDNVRRIFGNKLVYAASVKETFKKSPFVLIATNDSEFKRIDQSYIFYKRAAIFDCWRLIAPSKFKKSVEYSALGQYETH